MRVSLEGLGHPLVVGKPGLKVGEKVRLMVRPEKLHLSKQRPASHERVNFAQTRIESVTYFGPHTKLLTRSGELVLQVQQSTREAFLTVGAETWLSFEPEAARVVD